MDSTIFYRRISLQTNHKGVRVDIAKIIESFQPRGLHGLEALAVIQTETQ
jgi:hypothetical protein